MPNPNSPLTRVRLTLVRWLDPYPDKGEAWCMNCVMNDGRTLIMNASGHLHHVRQHRDITETHPEADAIAIRVNHGFVAPHDGDEED